IAELAAVKADYYIKKGEYDKAKNQLIVAIEKTKNRKHRGRYTYILAQLYQELNNQDSAAFYYTSVLKKNMPYVMEFNARINRALMASANTGSMEAIKRELKKMAKDDKNIEYLDRIYYALGDIALDEGDKDLAVEYLKKSVASSGSNMTQKAVSYFTIADLHFERPEYELAAAYYDTAAAILPLKHKEYERVKTRQLSLADLVKNIKTIAHQDSMLELGNLSESELAAVIEEMVETARAAEEQKKFDADNGLTDQQQLLQLQQNEQNGLQASGSGWYFYNSTAMSFGANNFRQKWGDRKLEDNWRRSGKQSNAVANIPGLEKETEEASGAELTNPAFYAKNIPRTEAERDSANKRIQYAYYDLGAIYKEQLSENQRAITSFETLLARYPDGLFTLETYYQLYLLYKAEGNMAKALAYKNKLLQQFPDSEYAKILSDPNYLAKMEALKGRIVQMYDGAYANYVNGAYEQVIATSDSALLHFKEGKELPKFALLRALSIGKTEKLPVYRAALEKVIKDYPAEPEKEKAQELLDYVKGLMGEKLADEEIVEDTTKTETAIVAVEADSSETIILPEVPDSLVAKGDYSFDYEDPHYYVMIVEDLADLPGLKVRISNFNATSFAVETLTIKELKLSPKEDLIFVKGFKSTKKAMDYYNAMVADTTVFKGIDQDKTNQFIISIKNFVKFYASKDIAPYMAFFIPKYLLKQN
ncbi:tetratricopeptide repeat protein, partial [Bacteroidota bacterium]